MKEYIEWGTGVRKLRTGRPEWVYVPPLEYRSGREPRKADYRYEETYLEHLREYNKIKKWEIEMSRRDEIEHQEGMSKLLKENGGTLPSVDYFK